MKHFIRIVAIVTAMPLLFAECRGEVVTEADITDTIDVDTLGLEPLELFVELPVPVAADELFDDFLSTFLSVDNFRRKRQGQFADRMSGDDGLASNGDETCFAVIYEREDDLALERDTSLVSVAVERIDWTDNGLTRYIFSRTASQWFLTDVIDDDLSNTPNSAFLTSFYDFINDPLYRGELMADPLILNSYSEEEEEMMETEMTHEELNALMEELPLAHTSLFCIDYGQPHLGQNRKSVLIKQLSSGMSITMHFVYDDARWKIMAIDI